MQSVTLAQAQQIMAGALRESKAQGFKPMAVVVVDAAAQTVAFAREDGATALRFDIALGKAAAAVGFGINSRLLTQRAKDLPAFFGAIAAVAQQKFVPQTGAMLIKNAAGEIIGAAGASGGTGDEDEQIVIAGIAAAALSHA